MRTFMAHLGEMNGYLKEFPPNNNNQELPDDELLDAITCMMPVDMLQLHGHETPQRVLDIKARYGLPVRRGGCKGCCN